MAARERVDACVVGAGPAGLLLATLLARRGRRVTVLERQSDLLTRPGGVVLHPPALAVLDDLGLLAAVARASEAVAGLVEYDADGQVFAADYGDVPGVAFPYALAAPLGVLAGAAVEAARHETRVEIRLGTTVTALAPVGPDGAFAVAVTGAGGADTIVADVVVAADGKFSATRAMAGIAADVTEFGHRHLVLRGRRSGAGDGRMRAFTAPGFVFTVPTPRRTAGLFWAVPADRADGLRGRPPAAVAAALLAREPRLAGLGVTIDLDAPVIPITYHTVRPETWLRGNVVLLGDAAHAVHSMGGQGMNLSLQEAALLADAVDDAAGHADLAPLERYQRVRRPFVDAFQRRQAAALEAASHASLYEAEFPLMALGQPDAASRLVAP
jgi:2-polyprenyl-6-methoxyphenol hydroxylase-like FAD-dependent oxidoreductase